MFLVYLIIQAVLILFQVKIQLAEHVDEELMQEAYFEWSNRLLNIQLKLKRDAENLFRSVSNQDCKANNDMEKVMSALNGAYKIGDEHNYKQNDKFKELSESDVKFLNITLGAEMKWISQSLREAFKNNEAIDSNIKEQYNIMNTIHQTLAEADERDDSSIAQKLRKEKNAPTTNIYFSCLEAQYINNNKASIYLIYLEGFDITPFYGLCEKTGHLRVLVLSRKFLDKSEVPSSFEQTVGGISYNKNYFIGLEKLYALTNSDKYELEVQIDRTVITYKHFAISGPGQNYTANYLDYEDDKIKFYVQLNIGKSFNETVRNFWERCKNGLKLDLWSSGENKFIQTIWHSLTLKIRPANANKAESLKNP